MKVLNFGSVNIDHVYQVDHFVQPGETLASQSYQLFAGGKGFNQSVALARAGAPVHHVGKIGPDGLWLGEQLKCEGVDIALLQVGEKPTGHAIIQVAPGGENAIIIHGGSNRDITLEDITHALNTAGPGDYLLVQNETNAVADLIAAGSLQGMKIVFNPAPFTAAVMDYPLDLVDLFILNEIEARALSGKSKPREVGQMIRETYPRAGLVLTMGRKGSVYFDARSEIYQPAHLVAAVDTTAAGDTFIGFFLANLLQTGEVRQALADASLAAALCVTRRGAADSIPLRKDLDEMREAMEKTASPTPAASPAPSASPAQVNPSKPAPPAHPTSPRLTAGSRLMQALGHARQHRREILASTVCGCFSCCEMFKPTEIRRWKDFENQVGQTAFCPKCGADSVIGDQSGFPVTNRFLKKLHGYWY